MIHLSPHLSQVLCQKTLSNSHSFAFFIPVHLSQTVCALLGEFKHPVISNKMENGNFSTNVFTGFCYFFYASSEWWML